jgi:hypothetical protein
MPSLSLNLVAIAVFTLTLSTLLGPMLRIPEAVPAGVIFGLLGLATLDAFQWQGQGGTIALDWLASFSPQHRERVIRHEAGHFLVAQRFDIPVTGYTLGAWETFRQGLPGLGGVQFDTAEFEQQLAAGQLSAQLIERYCAIWMAGSAAELVTYGDIQGGADDIYKLRATLSQLRLPQSQMDLKERQAAQQAKGLIADQTAAYEALVVAMTERRSVSDCQAEISKHWVPIG